MTQGSRMTRQRRHLWGVAVSGELFAMPPSAAERGSSVKPPDRGAGEITARPALDCPPPALDSAASDRPGRQPAQFPFPVVRCPLPARRPARALLGIRAFGDLRRLLVADDGFSAVTRDGVGDPAPRPQPGSACDLHSGDGALGERRIALANNRIASSMSCRRPTAASR